MIVSPRTLDDFIASSDRHGGPNSPGCNEFWRDFSYVPGVEVDQRLDPYGNEYVSAQLRLYGEISGRAYNQFQNEQTDFDFAAHVAAVNPYNHPDPSALAVHLQRLSRAFRFANLSRGDHLLDMGCGWGLSSELAAYLGLQVSAVDINPFFVDLVNNRAERLGYNIVASQSDFHEYLSDKTYDAILFYESLHHALLPWEVVRHLTCYLKPGGSVVLAGEPINEYWWKYWGIRLDALSIYCIRKFGWFESGWSLPFIANMLNRVGLRTKICQDPDPEIGYTIIATKPSKFRSSVSDIMQQCSVEGWFLEEDFVVLLGSGWMDVVFPSDSASARVRIKNFRARDLGLTLKTQDETLFDGRLPVGESSLVFDRRSEIMRLFFLGETWVPEDEIHNGDTRIISLHIEGIDHLIGAPSNACN
jgi:2-polyprenyl-3-methyl-5-hydroxy-6-metoxy-1,4-benzoquinol methylase